MSKFTTADFNTIMNYLEHLEGEYYKTRLHVDPDIRKAFDYDTKIQTVYYIKDQVQNDWHGGLFK